jgi:hypothetical protein
MFGLSLLEKLLEPVTVSGHLASKSAIGSFTAVVFCTQVPPRCSIIREESILV